MHGIVGRSSEIARAVVRYVTNPRSYPDVAEDDLIGCREVIQEERRIPVAVRLSRTRSAISRVDLEQAAPGGKLVRSEVGG